MNLIDTVGQFGQSGVLTSGTVMAFDFGIKRVGVAVGEIEIGLAHPLETVSSDKTKMLFSNIAKLIQEWQPVMLVVGLPINDDGLEHEIARLSQRFARRLAGRFNIKVVLMDERYTTLTASEMLREFGIKGKYQKPILDQVAAQQILQSFFDEYKSNATS